MKFHIKIQIFSLSGKGRRARDPKLFSSSIAKQQLGPLMLPQSPPLPIVICLPLALSDACLGPTKCIFLSLAYAFSLDGELSYIKCLGSA